GRQEGAVGEAVDFLRPWARREDDPIGAIAGGPFRLRDQLAQIDLVQPHAVDYAGTRVADRALPARGGGGRARPVEFNDDIRQVSAAQRGADHAFDGLLVQHQLVGVEPVFANGFPQRVSQVVAEEDDAVSLGVGRGLCVSSLHDQPLMFQSMAMAPAAFAALADVPSDLSSSATSKTWIRGDVFAREALTHDM